MYYEDDRFNFKNDNDDSSDKRMLNDIKTMDRGYFKIKKRANINDRIKNVSIELYCSGDTGSLIRNAITGHRLPFIVGSKDEDLFFKTGISSGITKNAGSFFYESPEQFENHQYITLSPQIKQAWNQKRVSAKKSI